MTLALICLGLFLVLLIVSPKGGKESLNKNQNLRNKNIHYMVSLYKTVLNEEDRMLISTLIDRTYDGDYFTEEEINNFKTFSERIKEIGNEKINEVCDALMDEMSKSYRVTDKNLEPIKHSLTAINDNILINKNEKCYYDSFINFVKLEEEKVISKTVSYGGLSSRNGSLKMGTMNYKVIPHLKMVTVGAGSIIVTNKRIIFSDKKTVKEIKLNDILNYEIFKDSVILFLKNNKKFMISNIELDMTEVGIDLNQPVSSLLFIIRKLLK